MKIVKMEEVDYVELESFSKPILIKSEGLNKSDINKLKLIDVELIED